ncbi:unnamed protein product [Colias eurytheme]|nr:unnamed protein product [Colias eurytheme]
MQNRLRTLRKLFERKYINCNVIGKDQIKFKIIHVRKSVLIYEMLLNEFSKTGRDQQIWIMILLLQCYPKGLFSVYTAVAFFLKSGLVGTIPFLLQIKDTLFMLFVPAYLSESINTEYEKILKILWKQTLFCNVPLSMDLSSLPSIILLDIMYDRMKKLRGLYESKYTYNLKVIGENQVKFKIEQTKKLLDIYKKLMDKFDEANIEMQLAMVVLYVTSYPLILLFLYDGIRMYNAGQSLTMIFVPAILSDLIRSEYDEILRILWKQIFICRDERLLSEKRQSYTYIKHRPYKFYIWRAIRITATMPLSYTTICISHLIVAIQFSNTFKTKQG